ncbi:sigma-70 family RNA polymerase sigma factor [Myxococcota bacterium]|nr:sigma-70 family RNA polymerase sigma factor [Myxococcota bacterium]
MDSRVAQAALMPDDADSALLGAMELHASAHAALAARMLGDAEEAREVVQEAWLRAWSGRRAVRDPEALPAWLRAIVARECLRALRRRAARRWLTFPLRLPDPTDPTPGPERSVADARFHRALHLAADRLSPRQRLVWGLRFDEGWTVAEIAESTGIGPDTVRTHLGRALRAVRDRMEAEHGL